MNHRADAHRVLANGTEQRVNIPNKPTRKQMIERIRELGRKWKRLEQDSIDASERMSK
ncbi:MAG: hypothetical protein WCT12_24685 [Verrucomicrobiota bacterium]